MKSILRLSIVVLLAALGSVLCAADSGQIEAELKRIEILNRALDTGGLSELLATELPCPLIHSQYFAEKIAAREPELRELEQAKRDFGLKLARALDEEATRLQKRADSGERAKQAVQLLNLAAWTKAAQGYGNYVLLSRCESLATVPLAYLTADLDVPLGSVAVLRKRITPSVEERAFRIAVLNSEAPVPFIGQLNGRDSEQDDQMQIAWNTKWQTMAEWFKAKGVTISHWRREALPDDLAFFLDDEHAPEPFTTVNLWSLKRHNTLVFGHRDGQVGCVDRFMLFREKIGTFPTQPPRWWKPDDKIYTATGAAFENAWRPFEKEHGPIFQIAAQVYQQVTEGQFLDRETQYCRLAEAQKRTQSGKP